MRWFGWLRKPEPECENCKSIVGVVDSNKCCSLDQAIAGFAVFEAIKGREAYARYEGEHYAIRVVHISRLRNSYRKGS